MIFLSRPKNWFSRLIRKVTPADEKVHRIQEQVCRDMPYRSCSEVWCSEFLDALQHESVMQRFFTKERRTWRERLFSWPWRPWQTITIVWHEVPSKNVRNDRIEIRTGPKLECER